MNLRSTTNTTQSNGGMFFYLYDSFVLDQKYESTVSRIESRVIELGINGRVEKLTPLRNLKEILEHGIKQKAHTIVIVGNDSTLLRAINIVAPHDIVLGYIPLNPTSTLSQLLGILDPLEGCDILSRRIIKEVNLIKANQNYFLTAAYIENAIGLRMQCDNQFTLSIKTETTGVTIHNLGDILNGSLDIPLSHASSITVHIKESPMRQGWLKQQVISKPNSCFAVKKIQLQHEETPIPIVLDQETTLKTPLTLVLKPKQQKIIMGKDRRV